MGIPDSSELEAAKETLVKAHRDVPALPVWSGSNGYESEAPYASEGLHKPGNWRRPTEEFDISDELDLHDFEDAKGKTIEESMAELQQMIDDCPDADDFITHHNSAPQSHGILSRMDPVSRLREECERMREEVDDLTKAKQEMERNLRDNVQKLEERIENQYKEKSTLTKRYLDAKQNFGSKQEEMLEVQQELHDQICSERSKKEQIQVTLSESLKNLSEQIVDLNHQLHEDWESQTALVRELDVESDMQSRYQTELHAEREASWRQNRDVVNSMNRAGKAPPLPLANELPQNSVSSNGSTYQPSIRSAWPFGMLRSTGPQSRGQEKADRDNQELKKQLDTERSDWEEQKQAFVEDLEALTWAIWHQAQKINESKVELALVQTSSDTLNNHLKKLKDRPVPARSSPARLMNLDGNVMMSTSSSSSPSRSISLLQGTNKFPRAETELGNALKMAADLRQRTTSIEEKQRELNSLQEYCRHNEDEAQQKLMSHRTTIGDVQAELVAHLADKDTKLSDKMELEKQEKILLARVEIIQKEVKDKKSCDALRSEISKQTQRYQKLQEDNTAMDDEVRARQGCWGSRAKTTKSKAPQAPQGGQFKGSGKGDYPIPTPYGKGVGKGMTEGSSSPPPFVGSTAPASGSAEAQGWTRPAPAMLGNSAAGASGPSGARETELPSNSKVPKKDKWTVEHKFKLCNDDGGSVPWASDSNAPAEVMIEGRKAASVAEAVQYLKDSPDRPSAFYLVRENQEWFCLVKRGKHSAEESNMHKSHEMMDKYVDKGALGVPPTDTRARPASSKTGRPQDSRAAGATSSSSPAVGCDPLNPFAEEIDEPWL